MNEYIMKELNEIEIKSKSVEQRILALKNIINMKIDYREQINKIEKLIGSTQ